MTADIELALRFAFSQGSGKAAVVRRIDVDAAPVSTYGRPVAGARTDRAAALPTGTLDLLEATPFPRVPLAGAAGDAGERLGRALTAAFGVQRREPSNAFNDHRGMPSVRSKFPVHAFVTGRGAPAVLDPYRHALLELGGLPEADQAPRIALAGRYTNLPGFYQRLRGSLTDLETGIGLRALCVGLEQLALPYRLRLPGSPGAVTAADLGLAPHEAWSTPVTVELGETSGVGRHAPSRPADPPSDAYPAAAGDPTLAEIVAVNRAVLGLPPEVADAPGGAVAAAGAGTGHSWARVLWDRSSGRMPRNLSGMAGRRRPVAAAAIDDAVAWARAEPPSALLRQIGRSVTVTACLQEVEGRADGVYRLADGALHPVALGAGVGAKLERHYGYPLSTTNGCDVRHAAAVWFFSVPPGALLRAHGPAGWTLAQWWCGWAAQGLCTAAAAHGLYARPARAFTEIPLQRVLRLEPDAMLLFSVISGTARFREPMLDLRI